MVSPARLGVAWRHLCMPAFVAVALTVLSLLFLRAQLIVALGLTWSQALQAGFWHGVNYDVLVSILVLVLAQMVGPLLREKSAWLWRGLVLFVWITAFANLMYVTFFGSQLDLWVVSHHWEDIALVGGGSTHLAPTLLSLFSAACAIGACLAARGGFFVVGLKRWAVRTLAGGAAIALLWLAPIQLDRRGGSAPMNNNVLRAWFLQSIGYDDIDVGDNARLMADVLAAPADHVGRVLASYRDAPPGEIRDPEANTHWPLLRHWSKATDAPEWRRRLGLPESGPIHVVILFLESLRAYEVQHPRLGPLIAPNLRRIMAERGLEFTQTYTSSQGAGQTVRGQFTTLCSMLDNLGGESVYRGKTTLHVRCLPEFLKQHGYRTYWFNSHEAGYHGKRAFESAHGMDHFFDGAYYAARGIKHRIGDWGLADEPVLMQTVRELEAQSQAHPGTPLFAHILTISTHFPYTLVPGYEPPDELNEVIRGHEQYRNFLSAVRYSDHAAGRFVDALFKSTLGDRTLLVIMADHGTTVLPPDHGNDRLREEISFRILLTLVTRNMPEPTQRHLPVHQLDVAPTLAHVLGLDGEVTWIGRSVLPPDTAGSPWLYAAGERLSFRTPRQVCNTPRGQNVMRCWDTQGADPLLTEELPEVAPDAALVAFYRGVIRDLLLGLHRNRLAPR